MANWTQEEAARACAALRAEHNAQNVKAELESTAPRTVDMTVREALQEMSMTMLSDKFWSDFAEPLKRAVDTLENDTGASGYQRAMELLDEVHGQLSGLPGMFEGETGVLSRILALLRAESSGLLDYRLPGVKSTKSAGHVESNTAERQMKAAELQRLAAPIMHQFPMSNDPWEFEEVMNQVEITVTIPVPAGTAGKDIQVKFRPDTLFVSVAGHETQPVIIDGELAGAVDPEACNWSLDGSGDKRKLVLDMEKTMGGLMWHGLLKRL